VRIKNRDAEHALCAQRAQVRAVLTHRKDHGRRLKTTLHDKARQEAARHAFQLAGDDVETGGNTPKGAG
jgi:hypothetical protein